MAGRKIGEAEYRISIKPAEESIAAFRKELQALGAFGEAELSKIHPSWDTDQLKTGLKNLQSSVSEIDKLFKASYNSDLGTLNIAKFNEALKKVNVKEFHQGLSVAGNSATTLFRNLTTQALTTNVQLKQTDKWLDKIAHSLGSTISWGLSSSVFNTLLNSVQRAWTYTKDLNSSLNDIRIVTGKSADEMERFARTANKAAASLGKGTKDYTDASLIYYQQGLSEKDVQARTQTTLKAANVTGQSTSTVSEQLTAVWNGYKVSAQEAELYVDKLAAVAATTAADLEELSTGMSKVASAASIMGVDIDQLNAQLATIVSVTRQAPESVGTALKTIYARMGDIEAGIDTETTLGNYTSEMEKMGFNVLDANGHLRDMGEVIEEIGNKWSSLSREQQVALSQTMAGTRQYNNLLSLFDNWDMYTEALKTSETSMGTLQDQQDIYMESTKAHLQQLGTAWEGLFDVIANDKSIQSLAETMTGIVSLLTNMIEGIGGGSNLYMGATGLGALLFGKNISQSLSTVILNLSGIQEKAKLAREELEILSSTKSLGLDDIGTNKIIQMKEGLLKYSSTISPEQLKAGNDLIQATTEIYKQRDAWLQNKEAAELYLNTLLARGDTDLSKITESDQGKMNDVLNKATSDYYTAISAYREMAKHVDATISELAPDQTEWVKPLEEMQRQYASVKQFLDETSVLDSKQKTVLTNFATQAETIGTEGPITEGEVAAFKNAILTMQSTLDIALKEALKKINLTKEEVNGAIKNTEAGVADSVGRVSQHFNELTKNMDLTTKINQVVQTLGSLRMTTFGFQATMEGVRKIFEDSTFTLNDFTHAVSGLSFGISALVTQAKKLGPVLSVIGDYSKSSIAAAQAKYALKKHPSIDSFSYKDSQDSLDFYSVRVRSKWKEWKEAHPEQYEKRFRMGRAGRPAAMAKEAITTEAQAAAQEYGYTSSLNATKAEVARTQAVQQSSKASLLNVFAQNKMQLATIGITLAIMGLTMAIKAGIKWYNKDATAAKDAAEAARVLKERVQEVREEYKQLTDTISGYKEIQRTLQDLVYGTEEWNEKLKESNQEVMTLLQTYPELTKHISTSGTGLLQVSETGLEQLEQDEKERLAKLEQSAIGAEIEKEYAALKSSTTDLKRQMNDEEWWDSFWVSFWSGLAAVGFTAATIATAGITSGFTGTGAVASTMLAVGAWDPYEKQAVTDDDLKRVTEMYSKVGDDLFKSQADFEKYMGKELTGKIWELEDTVEHKELRESLHELCQRLDYNSKLIKTSNEQIASSVFMMGDNSEVYSQSEYRDALNRIGGRYLPTEIADDEVDAYKKQAGKNMDLLYSRYLKEVLGYTSPYAVFEEGKDDNKGKIVFKASPAEEGVAVEESQIIRGLIREDARAGLELAEQDIIFAFESIILSTADKAEQKALAELISRDDEFADLSGLTRKQLDTLNNNTSYFNTIPEETLKTLGLNRSDLLTDVKDSYNNAIEGLNKAFEDTLTVTPEKYLGKGFLANFENITGQQERDFYTKYQEMYEYIGENGLKAAETVLASQNYSIQQKEAFIKAFSDIDWSEEGAYDKFIEAIESENINLAKDQKAAFANFNKEAEGSIKNLNDFSDNMVEVDKVLKKLKNIGDTISEEDYKKLGTYADGYFMKMSDGTYKLLEDAKVFYDLVNGAKIGDAKTNVNNILAKQELMGGKDTAESRLGTADVVGGFTRWLANIFPSLDNTTQEDKDKLAQQLETLLQLDSSITGVDRDTLLEWQQKSGQGTLSQKEANQIAAAYGKAYNAVFVEGEANLEESIGIIGESSDSLDEFKNELQDLNLSDQKKKELLEKYGVLTTVTQLNDLGDFTKDELDDYIAYLETLQTVTSLATDDVYEMALASMQLKSGIVELNKQWDDWIETLDSTEEDTLAHNQALSQMAKTVETMLSLPEDYLSADIFRGENNPVRKALDTFITNKDQKSYFKFIKELAKKVILEMQLDPQINKQQLADDIAALIEQYKLEEMPIGVSPDLESFSTALIQMLVDAKMTADQIETYFKSMNLDLELGNIIEKKVPTSKVPFWFAMPDSYFSKGNPEYTGYYNADPTITPERIKEAIRNGTALLWSDQERVVTKTPGENPPEGGNKDKEKEQKRELDWYHDVDVVLQEIEHKLNMIEKAQEKAFGKDLLESYMQELHQLGDQMIATEDKIKVAEGWADYLYNKAGGLKDNGVIIDPVTKQIKNYFEVYTEKKAEFQKVVDTYNGLATQELKDDFERKVLRPVKTEWEDFQKDYEKYEELINKDIPGFKEQLADILKQQIETQIEAFNMEIDLRLEISEADRDWNKFRRKVIEDLKDTDILGRVYANVEDFSTYYNEAETGSIQAAARHVSDLMAELDELERTGLASGTYEDDKKQALEDLKKYGEELEKQMEALYDMVQDTKKAYIDMLKEAEESFGKQLETYSQLSDIINHDMKVIDLVYGEDSYGPKSSYYNRLVKNDREQIDFQRQEVEFWAAQMSKAQREQNKEAYDEARKNWLSAVKEYNSALEKSIENIKDKYLNTINLIFDQLNDRVTNNKGLDYVGQEWDLINKNADQYLDDINRAYGITDLEKKYRDALNGTDSLRVQEKIKKIMDEELKALREKDKLTEYDVERAERKYEIMLKQIALEEAQQNKSQLRLRRDSQGNYTYQYVADEDAIAKAEADLEKAKNDLYNFDKAEYQNNLNQLYDIWVEFQEAMAEAAQINDPEERAAREKLIEEQYGQLINGIVAENTVIRKNLQESAMDEVEAMKDENLDKFVMEDVPYWTSGVQEMADVFVGNGGFLPTCKDKLEELDDATKEYERDLDDLEDVAEESFGMIKGGIDATLIATQALIQENDALIDSYDATLAAIDREIKAMEELVKVWEKYTQTKEIALDAHEYSQSEDVIAAQHAEWAKDLDMNKDYSAEMGKYTPGSEEYLKATFLRDLKTQKNPHIDYGNATTDRVDMFYRLGKNLAAMGKGTFLDITEAEWQAIEREFAALGSKAYANDWSPVEEWKTTQATLTGPTKKGDATVGRNTNFMTGVADILNDVSNRLDSNLFKKLADSANSIGNAISNIFTPKNSTTNQNVHIDASFPNVQSSNEILNALKNVVNVASQIANR